jgi:hypothetical protein
MGGRVAMTIPTSAVQSVSIATSDAPAQLRAAASWGVGSIYTSTERVLVTPRADLQL